MAEVTAMRNNALPYPVYGAPFALSFPILDNDGDTVTGAAGIDSEVSKNGDTFADCTNEATEIATSSGLYYLLLTATEMTADIVSIIVKTSTTDAKTTVLTLYPRKLVPLRSGTSQGGAAGYITLDASAGGLDDMWNGCLCVATIDSNVEARIIDDYNGSNQQASVTPDWNVAPDADDTFVLYLPEGKQMPINSGGYMQSDAKQFGGSNGTFSGGRPEVNTTHVGGSTIQQMGGRVDANAYTVAPGAITSSSFAASAIDSSSLAGSAISAIQSGLATASDLSTLYGYVTTTLGSPSDLGSGASIAANLVDIESQTDDIGVAGAGLTATGLATATIDTIRDSVVAIFTDDVGTAQAGGASTITLRTGAVATDDYYNGAYVTITGGTGVGQTRKITAYAGSTTKVATVDSNWVTNPDNTSTYIILGRAV
jgi:hypothetical protein